MKQAICINPRLPGWRGEARLYRLTEPFWWETYDFEARECMQSTDFVIVSSTFDDGLMVDETFAFPHDGAETDQPSDWMELPGSTKGHGQWDKVLRDMGYEPVYQNRELSA